MNLYNEPWGNVQILMDLLLLKSKNLHSRGVWSNSHNDQRTSPLHDNKAES